MREILCFGDSNTYGYIPGHYEKAPARYPWGIRWTSLLNEKLGKEDYRVIEEGLCGRTTVFEDSFRAHRNGTEAAFITAFDTTAKMLKHYKEVAWYTEIWSSDELTHLLHKNGDKFVGRPL